MLLLLELLSRSNVLLEVCSGRRMKVIKLVWYERRRLLSSILCHLMYISIISYLMLKRHPPSCISLRDSTVNFNSACKAAATAMVLLNVYSDLTNLTSISKSSNASRTGWKWNFKQLSSVFRLADDPSRILLNFIETLSKSEHHGSGGKWLNATFCRFFAVHVFLDFDSLHTARLL